jgi:hypothetical protein
MRKTNDNTAAIEPSEETLIHASAEPTELVERIDTSAIEIRERCRGYLLARKSPVNLGIAELAKKLSITEAQASDALVLLSVEEAISIALVRVVVTVKGSE